MSAAGPRSRPGSPIRVASWPHWYAPNRYLELFYAALAPYGIEHVPNVPLRWGALTDSGAAIHALHLHWPEPYWRERGQVPGPPLFRVVVLRRLLRRLTNRGIALLWTVHNLEHHEGAGTADRLGYRALHRLASLRIFHSAWARDAAVARYPRGGDTLVMPHGNYDGACPRPRPRGETLRAAGIPADRTLLLCFGQVRGYKGFDVAVAALDLLAGCKPHLVIAGRPVADAAASLHVSAAGRSDVTLLLRDLDDQEVADWLEAADLVLLPYRKVTGSGTLLHAATSGRAVVASDLPPLREVLGGHPDAGRLVAGGDAGALAAGVEALLEVPADVRTRSARLLADRYAWPRVVPPVAAWLSRHVGDPR